MVAPPPCPTPPDRSPLVVCGAQGLARPSGHPDYWLLLSSTPPSPVQTEALASEASPFPGSPVLAGWCHKALGPLESNKVSMCSQGDGQRVSRVGGMRPVGSPDDWFLLQLVSGIVGGPLGADGAAHHCHVHWDDCWWQVPHLQTHTSSGSLLSPCPGSP